MSVYVALLRGINLGQNLLKMERLRALCAEIGLKNVRTYVQSGNIVFETQGSAAHWAQIIERKLVGETRLPVPVLVRTAAEMARVVARNPFLTEKKIDTARLYVTFLATAPAKAALKALDTLTGGPDRLACIGKEVFLHCPDGYGRTKLSNNALEKALAVRATTRNWKTVRTLHDMCAG